MSDVAIVASVALVSAGAVAVVWLRLLAARVLLESDRAERERGLVPQFTALQAEVAAMRLEQKTFLASARARG